MISVDEAQARIGSDVATMRIVMRPLAQLREDVLAEDIVAREDIPLFDATAMDGYAIRSADVRQADAQHPVRLRVVGEIQPGVAPGRALRSGCAMRIFTGAVVPPSADAVIMQEHVQREADMITITGPVSPGMHIRRRGEEFRAGAPVLARGSVVTPAVSGLLATLGYARVRVYERPSVTLLVTGNELRAPSESLGPGQIRDANSFALRA
ncbi:MAG: molybdopterin molybdotransferase MoeA, partial [Bacteroidetes bacterium]|nr:molybdopterin molybdotransferase MoeA [Bacteroidota bacterium]